MADAQIQPAVAGAVEGEHDLLPGSSVCPYLPGRIATYEGLEVAAVAAAVYHRLMDHGCRRWGHVIYRMACAGCHECIPIRVPVAAFTPDKSQRRCWRRNADLRVQVTGPSLTAEKRDLYLRYAQARHGREESGSMEQTLHATCVSTIEMTYRDPAGRLLAVGLCDECPDALSSVYCYYDPGEPRRGLGTYAALWEIDYARRHGLGYYYLGFLVFGCRAMRYKSAFRPNELLRHGQWQTEP